MNKYKFTFKGSTEDMIFGIISKSIKFIFWWMSVSETRMEDDFKKDIIDFMIKKIIDNTFIPDQFIPEIDTIGSSACVIASIVIEDFLDAHETHASNAVSRSNQSLRKHGNDNDWDSPIMVHINTTNTIYDDTLNKRMYNWIKRYATPSSIDLLHSHHTSSRDPLICYMVTFINNMIHIMFDTLIQCLRLTNDCDRYNLMTLACAISLSLKKWTTSILSSYLCIKVRNLPCSRLMTAYTLEPIYSILTNSSDANQMAPLILYVKDISISTKSVFK